MIDGAFLHIPGIGPARCAQLQQAGICCWSDLLAHADQLRPKLRVAAAELCRRGLAARDAHDIDFFVRHLAPRDHWRILGEYLAEVSYFDVETAGLEHDAPITTIVCWHRGRLHCFLEHENLDDFLTLLDDVALLASFNGNAFDVPRLLSTFHIPHLPCPHLDLRWICYHRGMKGGLKEISRQAGLLRPKDLQSADGALAVHWWLRWQQTGDRHARDCLVRYCAADVLLLVLLAEQLSGPGRDRRPSKTHPIWQQLPPEPGVHDVAAVAATRGAQATRDDATTAGVTLGGTRLRGLRRRTPRG